MESKLNPQKLAFTGAAFLIPLIVYIITLAPTVTFIDSGELAAVCVKLGVAHPTGYPLFTILGHLFTFLPIGEEVYRLNLMCAVISSAAAAIFFNLMVFVLGGLKIDGALPDKKNKTSKIKADPKQHPIKKISFYFVSLAASLTLAFTTTFWNSATAIEVYSLHTLFICLIIFLLLKAANSHYGKHDSFWNQEKYWLGFAFVLGLSFTNHLSTIFLAPACIFLYFAINGFNKEAFKRIGYMAGPFIIGLSVYFYLFVRADNPVISWGNPENWDNFFRHVSGKQFSIWMFTSAENAGKQLDHFLEAFPREFYFAPILAAIPGMVLMYKRSWKLFTFTLLLFAFNVMYAINYDIYDIDSYFLLAYITASIWVGYGLFYIVTKSDKNAFAVSAATLLIALVPLTQNFDKNNESQNYFVQDYTMNVFKSASPNAIIMSSQWDFWVSASMYYQFIKNVRPDIAVIDKELMRKTWYMKHLREHYPDLYEKSRAEFDIYTAELVKFETFTDRYVKPKSESDRMDIQRIQSAFASLLTSIVDKNYGTKDFYTTYEIEQQQQTEGFAKTYRRVPNGVLVKYTKEQAYDNYTTPEMTYTVTQETTYHRNFIMNAYYNSFLSRASYLMNFSKLEEAEKLINKADEIFPNKPDAVQLRNKLKQLKTLSNK